MTPAQFNLLRATALSLLAPGSGVLRDGVREALAVVDAETARGLNAPRSPDPLAAFCAAQEPLGREFDQVLHANLSDLYVRSDAPAPVDTVVAEVRADLLARSERGIAKYGVTLDRTDLGLREWLVHFREELMDGVLYATRALRDLPAAAPVEPPHAAAPVLAPLAPEPPAAVLGRATEALAWDGQQLPVHVPFNPAVKHPYGDDAYQMTTDGVARMFPSREAAHRWLAAMGKAPV